MKGKTIQFLKENRGEYFHHNFKNSPRFLKDDTKAQTIKNNYFDSLDHIKVKSTVFTKKIPLRKQTKNKPTKQQKKNPPKRNKKKAKRQTAD